MFPNQNGIYNSDASTYIIFDYLKKTKHIDFVSKIVLNNKDISINQFGIYSEFNNHFFNLGILPYQSKRINDFVLSNNSENYNVGSGAGRVFSVHNNPSPVCNAQNDCFPGYYLRSQEYQNMCEPLDYREGRLLRDKIQSVDGCTRKLGSNLPDIQQNIVCLA